MTHILTSTSDDESFWEFLEQRLLEDDTAWTTEGLVASQGM